MLAAVEDGSTTEKLCQPIEMMSANNSTKVRALLRILTVEFNQRFFQMSEEFRGDILEDENIVRRGTALTGVNPTPESDSARR